MKMKLLGTMVVVSMAVLLAGCDSTSPVVETPVVETPVVETPVVADSNLALNASVTVFSEQAEFPGTYLVDGKTDTHWSADTSDMGSFIVDLGASKTITAIKFYPDYYTAGTLEFSIQGSTDGTTWTDIKNPVSHTTANAAADLKDPYTLSGLSLQYRYVKLTAISWQGWVAAFEFEVYGH